MTENDPWVTEVLFEDLGQPVTRRALIRGGALGFGALSLAALSPSLASAARPHAAGKPKSGGTLTMARQADVVTMDPILITDNMTLWGVFDTIYRGLVRTNDAGTGFQAELADSWQLSKDARTYTFRLRPGIKFSDGSPIKASDVVFSLDRLAHDPKSIARSLYPAGMKLSAPHDQKVVVRFRDPAPSALAVFGIDPIISEAWFKKNGAKQLANAPVGTCSGPWMFSKWSKGSQFVIKANPYYWAKGKPYLNKVVFNVVPNANSQVLQLESGAVDIATIPPVNQLSAISSHSGVTVQTAPLFGAYVIVPNFGRKPFNDPKVREAMNYALDKEALIKTVMFGDADPMVSAVPGPMKYIRKGKPWPYDVAKAKKLMAQSSVPKGFSTKILIAAGDPIQQGIATIAKAQWAPIGINLTIESLDLTTQQSLEYKYDYDLLVQEYTSDQIDIAYILEFTSVGKQFVNADWSKYYNPDVNKLWNQQLAQPNADKRAQQLQQLQNLAWNDAQMIYLFYPKSITALKDTVHGFAVNPTAHYFLENAWKA